MIDRPALPDWLPWWVPILVLVPALLFALAFLLMPFSVFGVKGRLEAVEARLDEIQGEIRSLALRLPEPVHHAHYDEAIYAHRPRRAAARAPGRRSPAADPARADLDDDRPDDLRALATGRPAPGRAPGRGDPRTEPRSTGHAEPVRLPCRDGPRLMRPSSEEQPVMRVSVVQMSPGHDKAENIAQAGRLIDEAIAADRPNIVSLPEMWTCLGGDRGDQVRAGRGAAAARHQRARRRRPTNSCAAIARERAHPRARRLARPRRAGDKLFNTTVVFDPEGARSRATARSTCSTSPRPDGKGYRESATYGAGDEIVTYEADGVKVGCAICYDLRFPELFLALRRAGRRADLPALRLHRADRARPLGGADPRPRDRDPMLVRRPRDLGQAPRRRPASRASPTGIRWSATPGAPSSPRCRTASAGPPRGSTRPSPSGFGATCRCWSIGSCA